MFLWTGGRVVANAGDHDYTLTVENGGGKAQLQVTIKTPNGLKADRVDLKVAKGKKEPVSEMDDRVWSLCWVLNWTRSYGIGVRGMSESDWHGVAAGEHLGDR
jgi:hypothetical protein